MTAVAIKVLVVDDDLETCRFLRSSLPLQGYESVEASDGFNGLRLCTEEQPDIVLLDIDLSDMTGIEFISRLREWSDVPLIVVSEDSAEKSIIEALDSGADDYVLKPFRPAVLFARMRANLRSDSDVEDADRPVMCSGRIEVDLAAHTASINGSKIELTPKEFDLLSLFVRHAGRVLTHSFILDKIWGQAQADNVEYVRILVKHLRDKIERDGSEPKFIVTEMGVGYRFEDDQQTSHG